MKKLLKRLHRNEKGFTLMELLVVVAIMGALAAIAVPNLGKFIGEGKNESYQTELHDVRTATMALLADSTAGVLDGVQTGISDLDLVTSDNATLLLSSYMTGLNADGTVRTGATYTFAVDGTVTQASTP